MSLTDLAFVYALIGVACAVAVYRAEPSSSHRAAHAAITVALWPLWAPLSLAEPARRAAAPPAATTSRASAALSRVDGAVREAVDASTGTPLEALLPRDAADRIMRDVARAAGRYDELSRLLAEPAFDAAKAAGRIAELEASRASVRALATARLHLENIRRLEALLEHDGRSLEEIADLVQALRTQLVLARFAGSSVEGANGIVSEVWARVEALDVALDAAGAAAHDPTEAYESAT